MSTLEASEALAARGAVAPRVTLEDLKDKITRVDYIHPEAVPHFTIAVAVLSNGFVVIGKSAPASPENFDAEKGRTFALDDVLRQMWTLEGYLLRERLHRHEQHPI